MLRDAGCDVEQELEPLVVRLLGGQRRDRGDDVIDPEVGGLDVEASGLDLREVEDVVDDGEERCARVVNLADVIPLFRSELRLEREMREADDRVHRRADLMGHVREEHRLHLGGFFRLLLRAFQLPGLGRELIGLRLRLTEQLLRVQVALEDLQAHGDHREHLSDQRLLSLAERAKRGDFEHTEQRVVGHHREGGRLHRRRVSDTRADLEIVGRKVRQRDDREASGTFTNQSLTDLERSRRTGGLDQAVRGHALQLCMRFIEEIETRNATADHRHEAREKLAAKLRKRVRALQLSRQLGDVGLHPSLLIHRSSALLEHVNRSSKTARFVFGINERHGLAVVAGSDRLHRRLERTDRRDDPAECEEAKQTRYEKGRRIGDQHVATEPIDDSERLLPGGGGRLLIERNPLVRHSTEPEPEITDPAVEQRDRFNGTALVHEQHRLLRVGDPLAAEGLILTKEAALPVAQDEVVGIRRQQTHHILLVVVERCSGRASLGVCRRQQIAAHVDAHFGEAARQVAEGGERGDARFGDEPAARLDFSELQAREDTKTEQRHERHRQQDNQALGDRHVRTLSRGKRHAYAARRNARGSLGRWLGIDRRCRGASWELLPIGGPPE